MEATETIAIDAQPVLASEIPKAVKRVMDRHGYTYYQCCTMPLNLLIFLHDCVKMEEDREGRNTFSDRCW